MTLTRLHRLLVSMIGANVTGARSDAAKSLVRQSGPSSTDGLAGAAHAARRPTSSRWWSTAGGKATRSRWWRRWPRPAHVPADPRARAAASAAATSSDRSRSGHALRAPAELAWPTQLGQRPHLGTLLASARRRRDSAGDLRPPAAVFHARPLRARSSPPTALFVWEHPPGRSAVSRRTAWTPASVFARSVSAAACTLLKDVDGPSRTGPQQDPSGCLAHLRDDRRRAAGAVAAVAPLRPCAARPPELGRLVGKLPDREWPPSGAARGGLEASGLGTIVRAD